VRNRWKFAAVVVATVSVGAVGMTQASATPKSAIAYNKGDAEFCAKHLENIVLSKAKGSSGNCVYVLQSLMLRDNPKLKGVLAVDGDFGPKTDKAVRDREKRLGWDDDGLVSVGTFQNLAALKTTPAGKAHITGVVTNASTKPRPSTGGGQDRKPSAETPPKPTARMGGAPEGKARMGDAPNSDGSAIGSAVGRYAKELEKLM
jgi:peptidoglycan hydrolase-like protein with peptidoglycan-binding domain